MREHIYCEWEFIDRLLKSQPLISPFDVNSLKKLDCWSDFCKLIQRSHLHIDKSLKEILGRSNNNQFYSLLFKRISNGELKIEESDFSENDLSDHLPDLNGIYLVCKKRTQAEMLSNKYGVLVIPISDYHSYSYLFKDDGPTIKVNDNNYKNWGVLGKKGSNICNSMIIVDNYLLNDSDIMKENLRSIFISILPKQIEITFQLSIFSLLYDQNKNHHKCLNKRYDDIMKIIKEIRGDSFKVSLTIFKCQNYRFNDPKRFHGRAIITNNVFINCDGGFDLFKDEKATKLAIVNIVYPHFTDKIDWAPLAFDDYIKEAKKESDESDIYNKEQQYISGRFLGNKNLRLWNLLEKQ